MRQQRQKPVVQNDWFAARIESKRPVHEIVNSLADYRPEEILEKLVEIPLAHNRRRQTTRRLVAGLGYFVLYIAVYLPAILHFVPPSPERFFLIMLPNFVMQPIVVVMAMSGVREHAYWEVAARMARRARFVDAAPHLLALLESRPTLHAASEMRAVLFYILPKVTEADAHLFDTQARARLERLAKRISSNGERHLRYAIYQALDAIGDIASAGRIVRHNRFRGPYRDPALDDVAKLSRRP